MELFLKFFVSLLSLYNVNEIDNEWRRNGTEVSQRNSENFLKMEMRTTFHITTERTSRCVEIPGGSPPLPTQADIYDCEEKSHQIWYTDYDWLVPGQKFMQVKNLKTGACLGIIGGNADAENVAVGQTECKENPTAGQYWAFYPLPQPFPGIIIPPQEHAYRIRNYNNKCLTVEGDTSQENNAKLVIRTCDESSVILSTFDEATVNQLFRFKTTRQHDFYV